MLMVVNMYRPLTKDVPSTVEVMREIERACSIPFIGIINNSNLGEETTEDDVIRSLSYADKVSEATGLPVVMTTVRASLFPRLEGKADDLFPLVLQEKLFDII